MKKKFTLILILAASIPVLFTNCTIDPPEADFSASEQTSSGAITIKFSDMSTNNPDEWLWTFEGGTPSTSTERNPTVSYNQSGTYDVTLIATNEGGDDVITAYDYINIVQFNNPLYTDMDVTVDGITKTMSPDSYVQFAAINSYSVPYYAETAGKTTSGTIVGLDLFWDETVDLSNYTSFNLILDYNFIFLYITNPYDAGNFDLSPFIVNYGHSDQTIDNITIPCDGLQYGTGYYYTNYGMEVRAYYLDYPTSYESWTLYPNMEDNQYMNLVFGKSTKKISNEDNVFDLGESEFIYSVEEIKSKSVIDPKAKNLPPSNRK